MSKDNIRQTQRAKEKDKTFEGRYNACFIDFGLKIGSGLLLGSMMGSFFFCGARKWPSVVGAGLGFGMAYSNCERNLNDYLMSMDPKACIIKKTP